MTRARDLFNRLTKEGESVLDEFIAERTTEQLFLDFKTEPQVGSLVDVLGKAVSGFGNSDGGVVVWGVDCRDGKQLGDVASSKKPIRNPQKFRSELERRLSGSTIPPHPLVKHAILESSSGDSGGYVATLIPRAPNLPLQHSGRKTYYMRSGSTFEPITHGVLSAMFGRTPTPQLDRHWEIHHVTREDQNSNTMLIMSALKVINRGPVIAREPYANINVVNKLGNGCTCRVNPVLNSTWPFSVHGRLYSTIARETDRLPPGGGIDALNVELSLPARPERALRLECTVGCNNAAPFHFVVHAEPEQIAALRDEFFSAMPTQDRYNHKAAKHYGRKLFSLECP